MSPPIAVLAMMAATLAVDLFVPATASAQGVERPAGPPRTTVLEDVIVTADRTERTMQRTPIAMSTITGAEITQQGRSRIEDILQNAPAVVVQGAGRGQMISIRGLGSDLPPQNGQGAVSQNYDGVYNFRSEANMVGFYDLDRVEVLRGPQGTLYGRNATGGVVNVVSADPELDRFGGYATGEVGNYDLFRGEGAVNAPLSDQLAVRLAFAAIHRDGYLSNGHDDNKSASARVKLLYKPSDNLSLLAGAEYSKTGGKSIGYAYYPYFAAGNYWDTRDPAAGKVNFWSYKVWVNLNAKLGPGTLTVLPAYQRAHGKVLSAFGSYNPNNGYDPKLAEQKSIEVRYAADPGAAVKWSVGYFHYDSENISQVLSEPCTTAAGEVLVPQPGFTYRNPAWLGPGCRPAPAPIYALPTFSKTRTDAVFGQLTYPVTESLRLIGGFRYTRDYASSKTGSNSTFGGDLTIPAVYLYDQFTEKHWQYRAGFEFDAAPQTMLYGTVANGRRAGGFNFDNTAFGSERLTTYEVGVKSRLFGNRLQLNGDIFYYDYKDYQLAQTGITSQGSFTVLFVNLPTARQAGVELDALAQVTQNDLLNLSVVHLDGSITSTAPGLIDPEAGPISFDGSVMPHSPKWSIKGSYSHRFVLGDGASFRPRIDVRYVTGQATKPLPVNGLATAYAEAYQDAYTMVDLSALFASGRNWSLTAYVKNVTEEAVKTGDFFNYVSVQPPRTWGATMTVSF